MYFHLGTLMMFLLQTGLEMLIFNLLTFQQLFDLFLIFCLKWVVIVNAVWIH